MEINSKCTFLWGVAMLVLSISFGAMGAHALENVLDHSMMKSFQTAVNYMLYQGLAFLILSMIPLSYQKWSTVLMKIGIICFSGSIFILVVLKHLQMGVPKIVVFATPIGGSLLIIGWIVLFFRTLFLSKTK